MELYKGNSIKGIKYSKIPTTSNLKSSPTSRKITIRLNNLSFKKTTKKRKRKKSIKKFYSLFLRKTTRAPSITKKPITIPPTTNGGIPGVGGVEISIVPSEL